MENFKNEVMDNMEAELQKKIAFAKEHVLSKEEYEQGLKKDFEMRGIENTRELTDEEVEYFHSFREKINEATIEVQTLPEAKRAMEMLGFDYEAVADTLSHENAHGNKAEQLGAKHLGYRFLLIRMPEGLVVQPQANLYIPDEWDEKTQNDVLTQITNAPEEYGNELSEGDLRDLNHLNDKK
jgi:hypothetical protein